MRPENLINSITGILTVISVILVWATLLEMKQQRESTYKPLIAEKSEKEFVVKKDEKKPDFYFMVIYYIAFNLLLLGGVEGLHLLLP